MKITQFNPSPLEINLLQAFLQQQEQTEKLLPDLQIVNIEAVQNSDNPVLVYKLQDTDGDLHEVVVQFIQRPDSLVRR